jgi:hypothetical protein
MIYGKRFTHPGDEVSGIWVPTGKNSNFPVQEKDYSK